MKKTRKERKSEKKRGGNQSSLHLSFSLGDLCFTTEPWLFSGSL